MKSYSLPLHITRLVMTAILLIMVVTPIQVSAAPFALPATIKIGVIYPITGPLAYWGQEGEPFWRQAEADINHLAPGATFDLIIRSSDSTPAGALLAAQDLVNNEHVEAIVGLPTSPELSGAISFLTSQNIAVISSTSTGTALMLRQPDTVYRIMPNELYLARNLADLVMAQGYNRIAVIHSTSDWGKDYSDELINRLVTRGCAVESVAVQPLLPSAANYATEVRELADKVALLGTGPRTAVVMVMGEGDDLIIFNHARNYPALYVPWFSALAGPEILTGTFAGLSLPAGSNFAYTVGLWSQEYSLPAGGSADALLLQAQTVLGRKPRAEHVYLYDTIQLMAHAILLAGTYNGTAIANEIPPTASTYVAATGPFFFDGNGDRDIGDLAYTCIAPTGSPYEYHYRAFFRSSWSGTFDILPTPQPRTLEWLR